MWARLYGLLAKEFTQFLRDPVLLFVVFWLYTLELVMCTTALGFDVKHLKLGVLDQDRTAVSRRLAEELASAESFVMAGQFVSAREAEASFRRGELDVLMEIPAGFATRVAAGRPAAVGVVVDGTNGNVAARARAYMIEMTARFAQQRAMGRVDQRGGVSPAVRVWYNPDLTNTRFMALSMMAQAGLMLGLVLPAAAIVREKQAGTIEQLRVAPIRAHELFVAKVTPPIVVCLGAVFPSLLVLTLLGVPLRGDVPTLLVLTFVFLLSAVSLGVLVAAVSNTLQQAMLLGFFGLFPLLFLSGTVAPMETMPRWLQLAAEISPLRHYVEIVSGLFLKGAGMGELWPHAAALVGISIPMFATGWWLFRRQW